jgi:serine/threonine-protein kinase RsbW
VTSKSGAGVPERAKPVGEEGRHAAVTDEGLRAGEVEVRMRVSEVRVATVRAIAADIAIREDFDLDAMADLKLAVDEACATVLAKARPDGLLVCRLLVTPAQVEMRATAATDNGHPPGNEALGWHMLQVLTDSVSCWITGDGGEDRRMHVRFTITRVQAASGRSQSGMS